MKRLKLGENDGLFFAAGKEKDAAKLAGGRSHPRGRGARPDRGGLLQVLLDRPIFPMFEYDEDAKKIDFSHNPFSDAARRA